MKNGLTEDEQNAIGTFIEKTNQIDMAKQTDKLDELQEHIDALRWLLKEQGGAIAFSQIEALVKEFNEAITQERERAFEKGFCYCNYLSLPTQKERNATKYKDFTEYNKTQKLIT